MITDHVFIGDEDLSIDFSFLNNNKVTHVLNAQADKILNVYDLAHRKNPVVISKLVDHKQANSPLIGNIKYFNIETWTEHKVPEIENLKFVGGFYQFIEEAVKSYSSCLIISQKNKCSSIVIAIAYLLIKYGWTVHRCLEYINQRKLDIEITLAIIKQLQKLEE